MNSETNELNSKKWILFIRHYQSNKIKMTAKIDFVNYDYLDEYISLLDKKFELVTNNLKSKEKLLLSKIKNNKTHSIHI